MIKTREQQIRANLERLANIHSAAMSALEESVAILQAELESLSEPQLSGFQQPKKSPQREQIAERSTFCAVYGGRRCPLGNTLMFKFLERLASHPGQYVSHADLFQDVWNAIREPVSLRSVVKELRAKLRAAEMFDLSDAIDGRVSGHYRLILNRAK
ncbi:MAG: queC 2 [Planctomycetaceae bacterium]|nr:queC 2 [Planctomycetaceae bacterium]